MRNLRSTLQTTLTGLGGAAFGRWLHRDTLLVLTYHSVVDVEEAVLHRAPLLYRNSVTAPAFRRQLRYLHRHHHLLDGPALADILTGRRPWPERAAVLTFDDGLRNNGTVAAPLLAATETPALFFLPTDFLDAAESEAQRLHWTEHLTARLTFGGPDARQAVARICPALEPAAPLEALVRAAIRTLKLLPPEDRTERLDALPPFSLDPALLPADRDGTSLLHTMTWKEARALPDVVTLGAHGASHTSLSTLSPDAAAAEVKDSQACVEREAGAPCRFFAYPYGGAEDTNDALAPVFEQAGFAGVFTRTPGANTPDTPRFALRRINVPGLPTHGTFRYHASGLHAVRRSRRV